MSCLKNEISERIVIGSCIASVETSEVVCSQIGVQHFTVPAYQKIFEYIFSLTEAGQPADISACYIEAAKFGGEQIILAASESMVVTGNIQTHLDILKEKFLRRTFHDAAQKMVSECNNEESKIIDSSEELLQTITKEYDKVSKCENSIPMAMDYVQTLINIKNGVATHGVSSGINALEAVLGLLKNGNLITVAARPSGGKTSFGLTLAKNLSDVSKPSMFFSLEMDRRDISSRLFSMVSDIPSNIFSCGCITNKNIESAKIAAEIVTNMKIIYSFDSGLSTMQIGAIAKRMKFVHGIRAVIIDQLSHMKLPISKGVEKKDAIGICTKSLKNIAKKLDIPVILLAQLHRDKTNSRPTLASLKDSGCIEEDSDVVIFPHHEEGKDILIVAKNRNGAKGDCPVYYDRSRTMFRDLENNQTQPEGHGWHDY